MVAILFFVVFPLAGCVCCAAIIGSIAYCALKKGTDNTKYTRSIFADKHSLDFIFSTRKSYPHGGGGGEVVLVKKT